MSTKPGVTIARRRRCRAGPVRVIDGSMATMRSPAIATSPLYGRRPGAVDDRTPANHDVVAHSVRSQQAPARRLAGRMTQLFDHATVGAATVRATCVTGLELDCNKQSACALSVRLSAPRCRSARTRTRGTPAATPRCRATPGPTPVRRRRDGKAGDDQRAAGTAAAIGPVVQLDRELQSTGEAAAERQQTAVVAEHPHVATMERGPARRVGGGRGRRAPASRSPGRAVATSTTSSEPIQPSGPASHRSTSGCVQPPKPCAPRASRSAAGRSVSTYEWPVNSTTACVPSSSGGNTSTSAVGRRESPRGGRRQDRGKWMR